MLNESIFEEYVDLVGEIGTGLEEWEVRRNAEESYMGTFETEEDFAEDFIKSNGLLDSMPEHLRGYFDIRKFAKDLFIDDFMYGKNGSVFTRC